ncbi:Fe2+-enterobactin ABC transporter substrate-binding protein [Microbacterium sp.]|uniref:Fe2+-enterobactin ABC transporter substrate-binding protein n=1 Tax=Microbacterium sp. TaxID=51671 RepID=UPI003C75B6B7
MRLLPRKSLTAAALITAATLALTACSAPAESADPGTTEPAAADDSWPRTITHDAGETEIPAQPLTIVSTSVSITGTLLAIEAPLVASAATSVNPLTDDKGFFSQWADIADERGVEVLYPNLELDIEAIEAIAPDLIIGSTVGGDATLEAYDQLSEIAPTVLFDYGSKPWDELAAVLGEATGLEENATAAVADFDAYLAEKAEAITVPDQPTALISYQGAEGIGMFSGQSPQARIFEALGFEWAEIPTDLASQTRGDASFFTAENTPAALEGAQTLFAIPVGGDPTQALTSDPLLANQPAIQNERLFITQATAFRIDPFSARQLADTLVELFGK